MSLSEIKEQVYEINTLGSKILKISDTVFSLPKDIQPYYADQLLSIINTYYDNISLLKKNVLEYRQYESTPNLTIKKLERDLRKFK